MSILNGINGAKEVDLLVAFFDLTEFARFGRSCSDTDIFDMLSDYYELVGDLIEGSGGKVVKFMGDAGLVVYAEEDVNRGVLALTELKDAGDAWLNARQTPCRQIIKAHFGPVVCGQVGTRADKRFDLFGNTVNTAAVLRSSGFAMTPQVFRKLEPDTRKLFKKHTPPITYIPVGESHKD